MCPPARRPRRLSGRETSRAGAMEKRAKFHGSMTALVTPFKNGEIDEPAYRALIDWQITSGSHGLVPVGTTGESPTLTHKEHYRAVDICIDEARGRVPVIAGTGSNNTGEAMELARHAERSGADGGLVLRQRHAMGGDFIQLSGEDMTALAAMAAGGHGCISVSANVAPGLCAELMEATFKSDWDHALKIQDRLTPLHAAIFAEPGVNGAKYALSVLGRIQPETRLPLVPVGEATEALIRRAMVHAGLLNA